MTEEVRWIKIQTKRASYSHAILATRGGRIAMACGRVFDFPRELTITGDEGTERRCTACQRRLTKTPYLIPKGSELDTLLNARFQKAGG